MTLEQPDGTYSIPNTVEIKVLKRTNFSILPASLKFYVGTILSLRVFLKNSRPVKLISFIHVANILALISSIGLGIEVIVCERSDILKTKIHPFWKKIRPFIYQLADKIVVQNQDDLNRFPLSLKNKIICAVNPLLNEVEAPNSSSYRLISVGRLHSVKRYELIINAIAPILKNDANLEYWIFGEGERRHSLTKLISDLNLSKQIHLKGHHKNVEKFIGESLIFLMASESEGQPNAMVEALVQGVPSVCFGTSDCFYEIARFFSGVHIIEEGKLLLFSQAVSEILLQKKKNVNPQESKILLNNWNEMSYQQWNKVIL